MSYNPDVAYLNRKCQQLTNQARVDTAALNRLKGELRAERALADDLADGLVAADSICSLVAAREPTLDDPNREELRRVAHVCRDLFARYREARK